MQGDDRATREDPATVKARRLEKVEERHAPHGEAFNSLDHARSTGRAHVVCLGDSHVGVICSGLQPDNAAPLMAHAWVDPCSVVGATARGMANPHSRTNALSIFQHRIKLAEVWQQLVFQLGEVDCGYTIWLTAEKRGTSIEELMLTSIDNYVAFLGELHSQGFEELFVLSAPATGDARDMRGHGAEAVSQRDRTDLTLRYNEELERRAGLYEFVDVTTPTLDPATGLVAAAFLNDPIDHHLADEPYGRLTAERLGPLLSPPEHA